MAQQQLSVGANAQLVGGARDALAVRSLISECVQLMKVMRTLYQWRVSPVMRNLEQLGQHDYEAQMITALQQVCSRLSLYLIQFVLGYVVEILFVLCFDTVGLTCGADTMYVKQKTTKPLGFPVVVLKEVQSASLILYKYLVISRGMRSNECSSGASTCYVVYNVYLVFKYRLAI